MTQGYIWEITKGLFSVELCYSSLWPEATRFEKSRLPANLMIIDIISVATSWVQTSPGYLNHYAPHYNNTGCPSIILLMIIDIISVATSWVETSPESLNHYTPHFR